MPFDYYAWLRKYSPNIQQPRIVRLSGESVGDESAEDLGSLSEFDLPEVATLTARDLFALQVERDFWWRHFGEDDKPEDECGR